MLVLGGLHFLPDMFFSLNFKEKQTTVVHRHAARYRNSSLTKPPRDGLRFMPKAGEPMLRKPVPA